MRSTLKCDILLLSIVGVYVMNTKIIYISGNEVFEMADIRAAFETVRKTLGLSKDTVLFGVPVDCDNALDVEKHADVTEETFNISQTASETTIETKAEVAPAIMLATDDAEVHAIEEIEPFTDIIVEPVIDKIEEEPVEVPGAINEIEEVEEEAKVIPILSVLAAKDTQPTTDTNVAPQKTENEKINVIDDGIDIQTVEPVMLDEAEQGIQDAEIKETITDVNIDTDIIEIDGVGETDDKTQKISISDTLTEDAPEEPMEASIMQLLDSMQPLREDMQSAKFDDENEDLLIDVEFDNEQVNTGNDDDATLAQLANEFAEKADKIPSKPKSESQGKIGKLKSILPFSKQKREDTGLMGDLFGWAGVAANDEDFAIPGFFTTNVQKKQGA